MAGNAETGLVPVERLLKPRSIAIVGASDQATTLGGAVLANLQAAGFPGALHLVSRTRAGIGGRPCVASIDELPEGIDAVLLNVPVDGVIDAVTACARRGVGGVVVLAAGFAEAGEDGARRQAELARIAHGAGMAVLGPNCMGFVNVRDRVPLTFDLDRGQQRTGRPGVAVVAQSGAMAGNIRQALEARGLLTTYMITSGNEAVCGLEDFLAFLLGDADTRAIAMFAEEIRRPQLFLSLAGRALDAGKPIVLMHPGRSARARSAAQSHTGALAGDHAVMRTLLARRGVVVVDKLDTLFDVATLLALHPQPTALSAVMLTNSGAIRGVALDYADEHELDFAPLAPETIARLKPLFPPGWSIDNPFDMGTFAFGRPQLFGEAAEILLSDPGAGAMITAMIGGATARLQLAKSDHILPVYARAGKPAALTIVGDVAPLDPAFMAAVDASGVPFFRSIERSVAAMAGLANFARARLEARRCAPLAPAVPVVPAQTGALTEAQAKIWLRDAGVCVPAGGLATSLGEAGAIADRIGFPVALKAQARELQHKSDAGGVVLGISDGAALARGWRDVSDSVKRVRPDLTLDGVLIERMAPRGLELVVGARRDPKFGPVLLAGLGGTQVEALGDVRLIAPDLPEDLIVRELHRLRSAALLGPWRGTAARDVRAVAAVLALLGRAMRSQPSLQEIEINPLMALADGDGVVALDAVMVLS